MTDGPGRRGGPATVERGPFPRGLPLLLLASALVMPSCRLGEADEEVYFDLEADSALVAYGKVVVELQDAAGNPEAILYDDSLPSTDRLRRLPAGPYRGGPARIVIRAYRGGRQVYRETRVYDGDSQRVVSVDIFLGPFEPGEPGKAPAGRGPLPPVLASFMGDTVVSIRDSVTLWAEATDGDGDLAGFALDCDGDGRYEDSAGAAGFKASILRGRSYADTGRQGCLVKVWDKGGRFDQRRLGVQVEWDPPTADAGRDTAVLAGTTILLHARGEDGLGPVVSREWKIGSKPFFPVTQQETAHQAPLEPGLLVCVLRITDSDGIPAEDTLLVTVMPRTGLP